MKTYVVILDAKGALVDFEGLDEKSKRAMRIAINKTAVEGRTASAKYVRAQLNLPASYVAPSNNRLYVEQKATNSNPEAVITARKRGVSLARFATNTQPGKHDTVIQVKPGAAVYIRDIHIVKLKAGNNDMDTAHNKGLGIFTKGGKKPAKAYKPVQMKNGMWLLYGPSVAQALLGLRDTGIWLKMDDELQNKMEKEYYRQMEL